MIGFSTFFLLLLSVAANASILPLIRSTDEVCPVDPVPLAGFQPGDFFNGQPWYVVGGPPMGGVTCFALLANYDASAKLVTFTQNITTDGGQVINVAGNATEDASSNAVYNYKAEETTSVQTILDTDYKTYGVFTQCQHGTFQGQTVMILSRSTSPLDNFDALVEQLGAAGYATDKIGAIDTSGCSQ